MKRKSVVRIFISLLRGHVKKKKKGKEKEKEQQVLEEYKDIEMIFSITSVTMSRLIFCLEKKTHSLFICFLESI